MPVARKVWQPIRTRVPRSAARKRASGEAEGLGHPEWLVLLLDREASWRRDKRFTARLRYAKLRQQGVCLTFRACRDPF